MIDAWIIYEIDFKNVSKAEESAESFIESISELKAIQNEIIVHDGKEEDADVNVMMLHDRYLRRLDELKLALRIRPIR